MPRACEQTTPRQAGRACWSAIVTDFPGALSFNGIVCVHGHDCPEHATAESGRGIGSGFSRRASRQGGHAPPLRCWMCASAAGLSVGTRPPPVRPRSSYCSELSKCYPLKFAFYIGLRPLEFKLGKDCRACRMLAACRFKGFSTVYPRRLIQ